jgi:hypothetical protein
VLRRPADPPPDFGTNIRGALVSRPASNQRPCHCHRPAVAKRPSAIFAFSTFLSLLSSPRRNDTPLVCTQPPFVVFPFRGTLSGALLFKRPPPPGPVHSSITQPLDPSPRATTPASPLAADAVLTLTAHKTHITHTHTYRRRHVVAIQSQPPEAVRADALQLREGPRRQPDLVAAIRHTPNQVMEASQSHVGESPAAPPIVLRAYHNAPHHVAAHSLDDWNQRLPET